MIVELKAGWTVSRSGVTRMQFAKYQTLGNDYLVVERDDWSSAEKPQQLLKSLLGSHSLVTAWDGERLIGLGNAITDGHLVVYYPHLLVHPEYQGRGVGTQSAHLLP